MVRYTLLEAVRSRLPVIVIVLFLVLFGLADFVATTAITESKELRLGLLAALLRIAGGMLIGLFVISSLVREIEERRHQLLLSMPITRTRYLIGRFIGFACIGLLVAVAAGLVLILGGELVAVSIWTVSFALELVLVAALGFLFAQTLENVTASALVVVAVIFMARAIGAIELIGGSELVQGAGDGLHTLLLKMAQGIGHLLPDLYRFTQSQWLIYGENDWSLLIPIAVQTSIYCAFLLACALFDFHRKSI